MIRAFYPPRLIPPIICILPSLFFRYIIKIETV